MLVLNMYNIYLISQARGYLRIACKSQAYLRFTLAKQAGTSPSYVKDDRVLYVNLNGASGSHAK